jgi:hypothetical protein
VSQAVAERAAGWIANRTDRRGFLARTAVGGAALAANPGGFLLEPISAYAAACSCSGQSCACGSRCCDGYTEFCCTITGNNSCPPGTVPAGWWKADGSGFCGGGPRYYIDCNVAPGQNPCSCGCANGNCGNRKSCCTHFRYGQCHQEIPTVGAIMCRVVTCTPPWVLDATCTTVTATDNNTRTHHAACLEKQFMPTAPGINADAGWVGYGVFRLYHTILGRHADPDGFSFVMSKIAQGWVLGNVGEYLVASPEFAGRGSLTDDQYVTVLYQQGLGRDPDPDGRQAFVQLLQGGKTRGDIANVIAQSTEAQNNLVGRITSGYIQRTYLAAFVRAGEPAGLYYWDRRLWEGVGVDIVTRSFCLQPEFTNRYNGTTNRQFVEALYQNVLGRPGDDDGIDYWTGLLDQGTQRYAIVTYFADSPEFRERTGIK